MVVCKVVALFLVSKCELFALFCEIASIMWITYLLGSIFFTFMYICEMGVKEKIGVFDYQ